ncbi:type III pantothenate kinase [Polaribacter pacificus]|nr:type III pantothenate kinase [Polaribacter pacificus]
MNLIIDVGNTRIKAAVFENDRLTEHLIFEQEQLLEKVEEIVKKYAITAGILSSVSEISQKTLALLHEKCPFVLLNSETKVPFVNKYATPNTLGVDRIASMANAAVKYSGKNVLVIDAGTCITYDFINDSGSYLGGIISPGIEMRYKALHSFTAKLPLLTKISSPKITGDSTVSSMHSGVINAVLEEVKGFISSYENKNKDLTIVLTGGDTNFLAKQLKSSIFANPNFVLEGLNAILIHNK